MSKGTQVLSVATFALCLMAPAASLAIESAGQAATNTVYLIGRDGSGHSLLQQMPSAEFQSNLTEAFSAVQDALAPNLRSQGAEQIFPNALELRTIAVGIGLTGLIGLGPLFHVSVAPKVRLIFTNSKTPVYPD